MILFRINRLEDYMTDLVNKGKSLSTIGLFGVFVGFMVVQAFSGTLLFQLFGWDSVDYGDLSTSTEVLFQNVIAPDLVVTALIVVLVVVLGWWTLVTREKRRVPLWMWLFPIFIVGIAALTTDWSRLSDEGGGYIAALAAATLIVGFNEEFMFRGVLLHGFRQTGSEVHAWAWATTLFALAHGMNLFNGEPIIAVMPQILSAFLLGTLLYLTRRVSGSIWLAIFAHGFWDFAVLSRGGSGSDVVPGGGTEVFHLQNLVPVIVPVLFIVAMIAHKQWMHPEAEEPVPAQAQAT